MAIARKKPGPRPFGRKQKHADIIALIRRMQRRQRGGHIPGLSEIADKLNAGGFKSPSGKSWTYNLVYYIVRQHGQTAGRKRYAKKTQLHARQYLTDEQIDRAYEILTGHDMQVFRLLLETGLRASEAVALLVNDCSVTDGRQEIQVKRGKGNKQRVVYIDESTVEIVRDLIRGKKARAKVLTTPGGRDYSYKKLYRQVKRVGRAINVEWLFPHALRHTYATFLYNYKKDIKAARDQLGHSSISTTDIYAKSSAEQKLESAAVFRKFQNKALAGPKRGDSTSKRTAGQITA